MKTLKITLFAIFAIVLFTGVSRFKENSGEKTGQNQKQNSQKIKLTASIDIKVKDVPEQG